MNNVKAHVILPMAGPAFVYLRGFVKDCTLFAVFVELILLCVYFREKRNFDFEYLG